MKRSEGEIIVRIKIKYHTNGSWQPTPEKVVEAFTQHTAKPGIALVDAWPQSVTILDSVEIVPEGLS